LTDYICEVEEKSTRWLIPIILRALKKSFWVKTHYMELRQDQREKIQQYISKFKTQLEEELSSGEWQAQRRNKELMTQELLSKEKIDNLTENDVLKLIESLWAYNGWTNKKYVADRLIQENGLENVRRELKKLIYGHEPLEERYDNFKKIKWFGTASTTEILVFVDPDNNCLWNDKPKKVLPLIGIDQLPKRVYKYSLEGKDYLKCIEILEAFKEELHKAGFENADFIDVDIFIWILFNKLPRDESEATRKDNETLISVEKQVSIDPNKLSHWDTIGMLAEIGSKLGYDIYVADPSREYKGKPLREYATADEIPEELKGAKQIERTDIIWIPTLEPPYYLFEVEDKGTMREALLRLYQAKHLRAKFIVVSPLENRSKFEKYVTTKPFDAMRKEFIFKSYESLVELYLSTIKYMRNRKAFFEE